MPFIDYKKKIKSIFGKGIMMTIFTEILSSYNSGHLILVEELRSRLFASNPSYNNRHYNKIYMLIAYCDYLLSPTMNSLQHLAQMIDTRNEIGRIIVKQLNDVH
jgi:hypothetical protein